MITTLNQIRQHGPCAPGWERLLKGLGKLKADDEPLSLETILEINGVVDAIWALRCVEGYDREKRLYAASCACHVTNLNPDKRIIRCIETTALYVEGLASREELDVASDAAREAHSILVVRAAVLAAWDVDRGTEAARDAAWDAACGAIRAAAWNAALAAARARWDAARARWDAARAARDAERDWQAEEFLRMCRGEGIYAPLEAWL